MSPPKRIDIVVPTYNCARWIDAFFDSLVAQDYENFHAIARDDGSSDDTALKLEAWRRRLAGRMTVFANDEKNLGMIRSYDLLLEATTSSWVMMGDPNDVWRTDKTSLSTAAMQRLEARRGKDVPLIVASDATIVNNESKPISPSLWQWAKLNPHLVTDLRRMIVEHPGLCPTMLFNRTALNMALPLTRCALYQDWWLILIGCAFGEVCLLPEPTILYRRHDSNFSGIPLTTSLREAMRNIHTARGRTEKLIGQFAGQAAAFLEVFGDRLTPQQAKGLSCVARLPKASSLQRKWLVLRSGLWFSSRLKNIVFFILL